LVFNQLGFDFNIHYCGENLSLISFLHQSANCGMHQVQINKSNQDFSFNSDKCCSDSQLNIDSIDIQAESLIKNQKITNSVVVQNNFIQSYKPVNQDLFYWYPPPITKNKKYLLFVQLLVYG
jgi:hypothetical protein